MPDFQLMWEGAGEDAARFGLGFSEEDEPAGQPVAGGIPGIPFSPILIIGAVAVIAVLYLVLSK
jgi:hypothetical protein